MRHIALLATLSLFACGDDDAPPFDASGLDAFVEPQVLTMHDVSVLWPLPGGRPDALWPVTIRGAHGPLLPARAFGDALHPPLLGDLDPIDIDRLRVVSMRLDPCSREVTGGPCTPMLRLVAQPTTSPPAAFVPIGDGAVHLHYAVPAESLRQLADNLAVARRDAGASDDAPFGVHPALLAQGLDGPFAGRLRDLVLAQIGETRLFRITFTTRNASRAATWEWGRIDRVDGDFVRVGLDTVEGNVNEQVLTAGVGGHFAVTPASTVADALRPLYDPPEEWDVAPSEREGLLAVAARALDPTRQTVDELDCATCHIAGHLLRDGLEAWPEIEPATFDRTPPVDVLPAPTRRDQIRAFGYFGDAPQVNTRTVNDTLLTLEDFGPP